MITRDAHVGPTLGGGWSFFRSNTRRATKRFKTEEEAIALGRAIAIRDKVTFFIHKHDGSVREMTDYSNDTPH